ncbi:MAG TPA: OmpA family protein [Roseomonas sp.]|nr:OmpA family protein [Roseomonas sp.]
MIASGASQASARTTHPWFCFFDLNSIRLSDNAKHLAVCKGTALTARTYAEKGHLRLEVQGHATEGRNEAENMRISLLRSLEVQAILKDLGTPEDEITIVGLGASRPIVRNDLTQAQNRRVEIVPVYMQD